MMSNNKILTVSYGTFSCTLEGFDDSFGTMKAIAEYFRDLASDDRYFGAEPPQPDAEMLARIAQKEVSRRVQAREQEGKIVLSALEDGRAAAATSPPAQQAAPATQPQPTPAPAPEAAPEAASEPQQQAPAAPEPEAQPAPQPAAMAKAAAAPEDAVAASTPLTEAAKPQPAEAEADIVPGRPVEEVQAFFAQADSVETDFDEDEEAEMASAPQAPAADSIAAKLQRIRTVVAQHHETEEDDAEETVSESTVTEATAAETAEDEADAPAEDAAILAARRDIEDALNADDAAEAPEQEDEVELAQFDVEEDDVAAILNRLSQPVAEAVAEAQQQEDAPRIEAAEEEAEADEAAELQNLFEADEDTADVADEGADTPKVTASEDLSIDAEEPEQAEASAPRGRIIKVSRAAMDAAEEDTADTATQADDTPAQAEQEAAAAPQGSGLSTEEEDELAKELAALEADMGRDDPLEIVDFGSDEDSAEDDVYEIETEAQVPAGKAEKSGDAAQVRHVLPELDMDEGSDMSRLLAETDHQMDEPESATRRDAFTHLRAAVAAKKADLALGNKDDDSTLDNAFRNDLAEVVRPRRPAGVTARTERPAERPAPLKLVAEQRIDTDKIRAAGPVRPRRVAAVAEVEEAQAGDGGNGFAEFAAEMGATQLPELLEAAAAYMSFVEGREQFSRPQLMTKVRQGGAPEFTREDGLRSFGQLLRAGKIEKIKGGRFTVSEEIGFRPDRRAAAG